jgi:hypothetical protein
MNIIGPLNQRARRAKRLCAALAKILEGYATLAA